jgi:hypothetical protein
MPLDTQITRNGRTLALRWDYTMLSIMYTCAVAEAEPDREVREGLTFAECVAEEKYMDWSQMPIYYLSDSFKKVPLITKGRQTLKGDYTFRQHVPAGPDGEPEEWRTVKLKAGDVLYASRSMN